MHSEEHSSECHGDVESAVFPQATKPEVLPGVKVYYLPRKYWDFLRGKFFGGILKMLMFPQNFQRVL